MTDAGGGVVGMGDVEFDASVGGVEGRVAGGAHDFVGGDACGNGVVLLAEGADETIFPNRALAVKDEERNRSPAHEKISVLNTGRGTRRKIDD